MHPIGVFIAGAVAGYAVASTRKSKKDRGFAGRLALPPGPQAFALGPACSAWEIIDQPKANLLVRKGYIDSRLQGQDDPYKITAHVIRLTAPKCHTPRQGMRNTGELDLYTSFFDSIMALLDDDDVYSDAEMEQINAEFQAWHAQQVALLTGGL